MKMRCFASVATIAVPNSFARSDLDKPGLWIALLWRVSSLLFNLILTKNLLLLHSTYRVSQGRRTGQGSMAFCFVGITRFLRAVFCISHCAGNYRACSHTGKIGVTAANGTSLGFISRILGDFGTCVSCFPAYTLTSIIFSNILPYHGTPTLTDTILSFSAKKFDESDGLSLKDDVSLLAIAPGPHV